MDCQHARQLFDAYLGGELSPTLTTELGAHRVHCQECRRALALLEVTGHIIKADNEPVVLAEDFTDRLLHCMDEKPSRLVRVGRYIAYIGVPLAAAAVVALALIGVFDRDKGRVAGRVEERDPTVAIITPAQSDLVPAVDFKKMDEISSTASFEEWLTGAQENISSQCEHGETIKQQIDLTITQVLDILEEGQKRAALQEELGEPIGSSELPDRAVPPSANDDDPHPQD